MSSRINCARISIQLVLLLNLDCQSLKSESKHQAILKTAQAEHKESGEEHRGSKLAKCVSKQQQNGTAKTGNKVILLSEFYMMIYLWRIFVFFWTLYILDFGDLKL